MPRARFLVTTDDGHVASGKPGRAAGPGVRLDDRYEITALLGSGGMGSVFAAHDTALDRVVALKLLPAPKWQDVKASSRLLREARAMARIAGDGVAQVFDHGVDPSFGPYVVMERLEGKDLSRALHRGGPLPIAQALAFMEQIGATLEIAHERGILHRDLKPSNLFVCRATVAGSPRIKVLDFGLAKADDDDAGVTHPGDIVGTYAYLPPEAWVRGSKPDARTDVYSLAATFYEMLAGEAPFRAETRAELQVAIANDPPAPLALRRTDVPVRVARAIDRAMSKAPSARFATVRAFVEALGVSLPPPSRTIPGSVHVPFVGTARYRVTRVLAEGQGTIVYAGHDDELGRPVALKCVRADSGEPAARLRHEHRTAAETRHPNLVRIDDLVETPDELVLVMELVEGVPLLEHVAGSESRLRSALAQLVGALSALHRCGLATSNRKTCSSTRPAGSFCSTSASPRPGARAACPEGRPRTSPRRRSRGASAPNATSMRSASSCTGR
jgi:serine/threonine protein kinase